MGGKGGYLAIPVDKCPIAVLLQDRSFSFNRQRMGHAVERPAMGTATGSQTKP